MGYLQNIIFQIFPSHISNYIKPCNLVKVISANGCIFKKSYNLIPVNISRYRVWYIVIIVHFHCLPSPGEYKKLLVLSHCYNTLPS